MGGGGEAADIDIGAGRKVHAAGVGQKHLAIGIDLAKDLARVGVEHAVEQGAVAAGLSDVDRGVRTHVKCLPVDDGLRRLLLDGHHRRGGGLGLADSHGTSANLRTGGQLQRHRGR